MGLFDFQQYPTWINFAVFAVGAAVVWAAGTRLSRYADAISERTGLGTAFIGALLLGGVTSMPEIATTLTASITGNAPLAVNNVLGGVAMQIAILALADAVVGRQALSAILGGSVVLLQGTLLLFVLALTAAGITAGEVEVFGFGVWTLAVFVVSLLGLYLIKRHEAEPQWRPEESETQEDHRQEQTHAPHADTHDEEEAGPAEEKRERVRSLSTRQLVGYTALAALVIFAAGFVVARTGEALSEQTGLGASFVGAILVAIATSLPEVSTTFEAVRLGRPKMAFSNIFGTNLFDAALLFVADVTYRGAAVLDEVGTFSQFGALLGVLLTAVYLAGIIQRQNRTVLRMGLDSLLVLLLYLGGVAILYGLR